MRQCFCIQPFDDGVFDKRFDDIFKPAIVSAGLLPYRVDRDPSVSIPIDDIENGIKNSELCFAEITTDNPNVWFELGYAIAVPKNVVIVCSEERKSKFPFDIQHRSVIKYKSESSRDFEQLKDKIEKRIEALLKKSEEISRVSRLSPLADTEGLSQHEIVALVTIMQNSFAPEDLVSTSVIKSDMNNVGFTDIAVSLALQSLLDKGYVSHTQDQDYNSNTYIVYLMQEKGVQWLMQNQDKLILKTNGNENKEITNEDDLPF